MLFSNYFTDSNKNLILILFKIFLAFTIYFNSFTSANAASVGGWNLGGGVAQGASTVYNGTKNVLINGKDFLKKGVATITPNASQVANVLKRGLGAAALGLAVGELIGDGVDWVLDPENNRVVYKGPSSESELNSEFVWECIDNATKTNAYAASAISACSSYGSSISDFQSFTVVACKSINQTRAQCDVEYKYKNSDKLITSSAFFANRVKNPAYDPSSVPDDKPKSISLDAVAAKVISNAETETNQDRKAAAQVATTAAAADIINEAEKDDAKAAPIVNQLENSATTENADAAEQDAANSATGQTKPNTEGGTDLALEFPAFCGWAPTVCQAAQVVINFPKKLENWWDKSVNALSEAYTYAKDQVQAVRDYFKEEKPEKEKELQIDESLPEVEKVNVSIGDNICPSLPVSIHTPFSNIDTDISPTYLCDQANGMKLFFIALGFYHAALIVGRRN